MKAPIKLTFEMDGLDALKALKEQREILLNELELKIVMEEAQLLNLKTGRDSVAESLKEIDELIKTRMVELERLSLVTREGPTE